MQPSAVGYRCNLAVMNAAQECPPQLWAGKWLPESHIAAVSGIAAKLPYAGSSSKVQFD
jgi:hypothetical protein